MTEHMLLKDLLIDTRDGDWGLDVGVDGHAPHYVIRGADFPNVRKLAIEGVPLRHLPIRTVDRRVLRPDDILIETAGGTRDRPTGRTLLVTGKLLERFDHPVIGASFTRFLRANPKIVEPRYLFWYLQAIYANGETFEFQVQHTGVARFQYTTFAKSKRIPLPDLAWQRAIAEVLGVFDDKIASNDRIVDLSDKLAEAVLSAALDGRASPLASQALVTMGSSPPGTSYNENWDGLPFYQGVRDFGIRFPRRRVWTTSPVRTAGAGDTLVSVRAPVGRTNIANEDMCIGRGVASLRSRSECPITLFHQVRAAHKEWVPYEAEGTVFGAINKSQLEAVPLPMVHPEAGGKVEQALAKIEKRIAAALSENETLVTTRDQLLPLLMSEKVHFRDVEQTVEGDV